MNVLALFAYLSPLLLLAVALLARREPGARPIRVMAAARAASFGSIGLAVLAGLAVFASGPLESPVLGLSGLGLSVRLDALSVVMFLLVSVVGALIVQFSRNYLDGDERHGAFLGGLCLTIAAVLMLVLAGNLLQLTLSWIATSLALHRLLVFYADRPGAVIAARKKFLVARLGDACLVGAAILLFRAFGTADLGALLEAGARAKAAGVVPDGLRLATILLVVAAALKSAMWPTHGWLLEVMETPTPVSALLHAGLINAGTFLIVRLSDVVVLNPLALQLLMVVGGSTALLASVAMVTQSSVKVSLAYSSAAHMGFMLLLCGLGAYPAAILHLVAHSFYKAHAFLSSGSVVEYVRGSGAYALDAPSTLRLLASLGVALAVFVGLGLLLGVSMAERPASMVLGALLVMALAHLIARALVGVPSVYVVSRTVLSAAAVALSFFALEGAANHVLERSVAPVPAPDAFSLVVMGGAVLAFAAVSLLQMRVTGRGASPFWRAVYVHLKHGLYANAVFDRLTGALRRA